jgi:hypothetical protein
MCALCWMMLLRLCYSVCVKSVGYLETVPVWCLLRSFLFGYCARTDCCAQTGQITPVVQADV